MGTRRSRRDGFTTEALSTRRGADALQAPRVGQHWSITTGKDGLGFEVRSSEFGVLISAFRILSSVFCLLSSVFCLLGPQSSLHHPHLLAKVAAISKRTHQRTVSAKLDHS